MSFATLMLRSFKQIASGHIFYTRLEEWPIFGLWQSTDEYIDLGSRFRFVCVTSFRSINKFSFILLKQEGRISSRHCLGFQKDFVLLFVKRVGTT